MFLEKKEKEKEITIDYEFPDGSILKNEKVKYKASINLLKFLKRLTKIPVVAIGGINDKNYKKLLLNNANFLAISGYIWNNKIYKPGEAIKKLK